jgi:hypothetical protein
MISSPPVRRVAQTQLNTVWTSCEGAGDNPPVTSDNYIHVHTSPTTTQVTRVKDVSDGVMSYTWACHTGIANNNVSHNPQHLLPLLRIYRNI